MGVMVVIIYLFFTVFLAGKRAEDDLKVSSRLRDVFFARLPTAFESLIYQLPPQCSPTEDSL